MSISATFDEGNIYAAGVHSYGLRFSKYVNSEWSHFIVKWPW